MSCDSTKPTNFGIGLISNETRATRSEFHLSLSLHALYLFIEYDITRPTCALDRCTIFCLYVARFERQIFNERLKEAQKECPCRGIRLHFLKYTI